MVELKVNNLSMKCRFMEIDAELKFLNVQNLTTPLGLVKEAQIKTIDIEHIVIY